MREAVMPHPQLNIRLDPRTEAMLRVLRRHLNLTAAGVIRLALARLMRDEGLQVPDDAD
jgi:hypothetical protein